MRTRDLVEFLIKSSDFFEKLKQNNITDETIDESIKIFQYLPEFVYLNFMKFSESDFDFIHHFTFPENFLEDSHREYNFLVDSGHFGKVIQDNKVKIIPPLKDDTLNDNFIIIPISHNFGIFGVLILKIAEHPETLSKNLKKFVSIVNFNIENLISSQYYKEKVLSFENHFEQKLSEKLIELTKSKNDINAILDSIQTGLIISQKSDKRIIRSNPIASKLSGYNELELVNLRIDILMDSGNMISESNYETFLISKDGKFIPILRKNKTITMGDTEYQVDSFLDISDIKKATENLKEINNNLDKKVKERTQELEKLIKKLEVEIKEREVAEENVIKEREMKELKSKFIASVSHEFRTPLTIIRTTSDLLSNYSDKLSKAETIKYLDRITKTSDYLTLVLQNILYLQDEKQAIIGSGSTDQSLQEIIKINADKSKFENNINSIIEFDLPEEEIFLSIKSNVLGVVIKNITDNAIKYNKDNQPIKISLKKKYNTLLINIFDSGIGIPNEELEQIYDLFFRASNSGNIPGVGLGLSVVKHNLDLIGGNIEISSNLNKGTDVTIKIPYK